MIRSAGVQFIGSAVREGVIRRERTSLARQRTDLEAASGGFDAVVQIAAARCLAELQRRLAPDAFLATLTGEELSAAFAAARPFNRSDLNAVTLPPEIASVGAALRVDFEIESLGLTSDAHARIGVVGHVVLGYDLPTTAGVDVHGNRRPVAYTWRTIAALGDLRFTLVAPWSATLSSERTRVALSCDLASATVEIGAVEHDVRTFY
jgi:hypothetical protein